MTGGDVSQTWRLTEVIHRGTYRFLSTEPGLPELMRQSLGILGYIRVYLGQTVYSFRTHEELCRSETDVSISVASVSFQGGEGGRENQAA